MRIPTPLDRLLEHLSDTGIAFEKANLRNDYRCQFPYPGSPVDLAIHENNHGIVLHASLPPFCDSVDPDRRPAVGELLHRINDLTHQFVWLLRFDTGEVLCRVVVPTSPCAPSKNDFQQVSVRLAIVLHSMIPPILSVAFEDFAPTSAAIRAELGLREALLRLGVDIPAPSPRTSGLSN